MKTLIVLVVGLLAVGCTTMNDIGLYLGVGQSNTPEQSQKALRDSVIGEYEGKLNGDTIKYILLNNSAGAWYFNDNKNEEDPSLAEQLQLDEEQREKYSAARLVREQAFSSMWTNSVLRELPREERITKSRELFGEIMQEYRTKMDELLNEEQRKKYEEIVQRGTRGSLPWAVKNGEVHVDHQDGFIGVFRINPDSSFTAIAEIRNGKRIDLPKDRQMFLKKVK